MPVRIKPGGFLGLKIKIWGHLFSEIVRKDLCTLCGACVGVCPVTALVIRNEKPSLAARCVGCGYCYAQCPHTSFDNLSSVYELLFSAPKDKFLGPVKAVYAARAKDPNILAHCQDGGVATALLAYALDNKLIEGAIVTGADKDVPFNAQPRVVLDKEGLIENAGSRYTSSPNLIALVSAVDDYKLKSIGFVGVGCQITALRKMLYHAYGALKYGLPVKFAIGLFCSGSFYYSGLFEEYLVKRGIDLSRITKMEITKGRFIVKSGDEVLLSVKLKEIKPYERNGCSHCGDFTAELADLSLGGIDSPDGWTTVIIRTDMGEKLFNDAVEAGYLETKKMKPSALKITIKLSKIKKKGATEGAAGS